MRVVRRTPTAVIAASGDVAIAVAFHGRLARMTSAFGNPLVTEQNSDGLDAVYRMAWRSENGCELHAISLMPLSADGTAMLIAIAHTSEPSLYIASPRVPRKSALATLLELVDHPRRSSHAIGQRHRYRHNPECTSGSRSTTADSPIDVFSGGP